MMGHLVLVLLAAGVTHPQIDINPNPAMFAALPCNVKGYVTQMKDDIWTCDGMLFHDQNGLIIWFDKQRVEILTRQ